MLVLSSPFLHLHGTRYLKTRRTKSTLHRRFAGCPIQKCYVDAKSSSSSSLGSRSVPWLDEGLSLLSPNYPVLCFPLPYRVAPVFVKIVSPPLGWSPLSSFLVIIMVSKWWHARSIGRLWGGWYALPRTISFFLRCWLYLWLLSSPWPRCWSFYLYMWCRAYFFPFWSVQPQVCSVLSHRLDKTLHPDGIKTSFVAICKRIAAKNADMWE